MNIQNNTPQSFQGRALIVKEADKICRNVNKAFPHTSPSYSWINYGKPAAYDDVFKRIDDKVSMIRDMKYDTDTAYDYYNILMRMLRKEKAANCEELSDITYLACKNKKFKLVNQIGIYGYNPLKDKYTDYDHMAVSFRHEDKTIIIDPWFGIADYAKNCLLKYKTVFSKFFDKYNPDLEMVYKVEDAVRIDKTDLKDLMKIYPELNK